MGLVALLCESTSGAVDAAGKDESASAPIASIN
jgi:hypothetical protein